MLVEKKENIFLLLTFFLSAIYIFFWENVYVFNTSLLLLLIACCAITSVVTSPQLKIKKVAFAFLAIITYSLMGSIYNAGSADVSIKWVQSLFIIFAVSVAFQGGSIKLKRILSVFATFSFIFMIGIYLHLLAPNFVDDINAMFLKGGSLISNIELYSYGYYCGFSGFNVVSSLFSALLMLICFSAFLCTTNRGAKKSFLLILAILSFVAIIIAQKRGVFIAATVGFIVVLFIEKREKSFMSKFLQISLILAFFVVIIYVFLINSESGVKFLERFNANDGDFTSGRAEIFQVLLEDFGSYVILGNGTGSVSNVIPDGAHNIYLQLLYEGGIIGLILHIIFFATNFFFACKKYFLYEWQAEKKSFLLTSIGFQAVYLVYGLSGNPLSDVYIFLLYIILSSVPYSDTFIIEKDVLELDERSQEREKL